MNLIQLFSDIEKVDPEVYGRFDTRRKAMSEFGRMGRKVALASLPLALGSMFKKAYGKTNDLVTDTLNFALALEFLEREFYQRVKANYDGIGVPAGDPRAALDTILLHEAQHVDFLAAALTAAGAMPYKRSDLRIDISGGKGVGLDDMGNGTPVGPFAGALSDYDTMLAVAQTLEDTGVRAYKGQAGNLISNNDFLTAALNIHSVEARHASHIRSMRKGRGAVVKPWVTMKDSGITGAAGALVQASYNGEELLSQAGVNIAGIPGISANAASESFDEPLTKEQVLAITGTPGGGTVSGFFFY